MEIDDLMVSSWILLLVMSGWGISLVFSFLLSRRYSPAQAWAWLAILLAFPWLGLLFYLLLGKNPLGRRRIARYRQTVDRLKESDRRNILEPHIKCVSHDSPAAVSQLAQAGGALPPVGGNQAALVVDPERIVHSLIEDIDRAEHHVHMVFYIFRDDETGQNVAEALLRAARRGVECRLLADAVGSRGMFQTLQGRLRRGGVEVRDALSVNPLRGRLARIDIRNHRKIVVIDGRVGYLGSWNVCNANYGLKSISAGHDVMVRLQGPVVLQMQLLFLEDWKFETDELLEHDNFFPTPRCEGDISAQVLPSGPMYPTTPMRDIAVCAIHQARTRVVLTTPYLIPDDALTLALRLAAQRGVSVDIIVPTRSNHPFIDMASRSYQRNLFASGVHIHHFQDGLLHAKTLYVDDALGMIGSANFDIRSFDLDVEANCLFYSPPWNDMLLQLQQSYIHRSALYNPASASFVTRLVEDWLKLISPLF